MMMDEDDNDAAAAAPGPAGLRRGLGVDNNMYRPNEMKIRCGSLHMTSTKCVSRYRDGLFRAQATGFKLEVCILLVIRAPGSGPLLAGPLVPTGAGGGG